jgi:RNase P subunit RPR2
MDFNPTICDDCQYPPNFMITPLPRKNNRQFFSVKCRDCGDSWNESPDEDDSNPVEEI